MARYGEDPRQGRRRMLERIEEGVNGA